MALYKLGNNYYYLNKLL